VIELAEPAVAFVNGKASASPGSSLSRTDSTNWSPNSIAPVAALVVVVVLPPPLEAGLRAQLGPDTAMATTTARQAAAPADNQ
jgi:hypothetical protein